MLRSLVVFVLSNVIVLFMFSVGLEAQPEKLKEVRARPAFYGRALAVVLVAVPLVAYALVRIFRLPPVAAGAVVLTAICPGAPLVVRQAKALNANVTTSLNLLLLLSLCMLISVPLWVEVLDHLMGFELRATPGLVVRTLLVKVIPPLVVGMAIQRYVPRVAEVLSVWCRRVFNVLLVAVALLALVMAAPRLKDLGVRTVLALAVLVSADAFLGHWAGGPRLEDRKSVALAAALAPPALTMTIIAQSYPRLQALDVAAVVGAIVLVRILALIPYKVWAKRQRGTERAPLPPGSVPT
ncbi:bile acid:sodium symporter [Pyxidicoccus parkwayensis]|uniref:Bile acid:sodium symporter n=1 Tax=Pyxidicoccus parkwayensis TaxID=2813578 RepID=A0ABX7P4K7_9BACT|nr:bile acid:sodium symporter [Pyxidicoccus parkwaysis]QSQ25367.1 bile acid:sodium symporter [Pyxidicoccus parkwaysis]